MDRRPDRRRLKGRGGDDDTPPLIYGVHPVMEAVECRSAEVERLFVARDGGARLGRLLRLARERGIPISHLPRTVLGRRTGGARHQGVAAQIAPLAYATPDEVLAAGERGGLLLLCDGVEDAGNLGAILRSAAAAGVAGVVLSADGTAGVSPGAIRASAGAALRIPVAREARPAALIRRWVDAVGNAVLLDPRAELGWDRADLAGPLMVVAGGEARGVRRGVAEACNLHVAIPLSGGVDSLNVANAVSVLLFEAVRQRRRRS